LVDAAEQLRNLAEIEIALRDAIAMGRSPVVIERLESLLREVRLAIGRIEVEHR
jgi:hypothetical protein